METITFRGWTLECDAEATRQVYESLDTGSPEACGCQTCRNFAAAREQVYPSEVQALYARFGIAPAKEAEIYHNATLDSGLHHYGGWHHFIGRVVHDPGAMEAVSDRFSIYFHEGSALAANAFPDSPLVQMEFVAEVPWVLLEAPMRPQV